MDETPIRVNRPTSVVLGVLIALLLLTGFWAQSMQTLVSGATIAKNDVPAAQVASR
jgi:hypothetical protein